MNFFSVLELINFTQPIYVWRDDPNSRQNTIKEIIKRANSKEDWPQVRRSYDKHAQFKHHNNFVPFYR